MSPVAAALTLLGWACAFFLGFAVNRGGTCAVAAMEDLTHRGAADRLIGLAVAAGAAGLVCLPLAWALGPRAQLAGDAPIGVALIAGGVLMGVGAVINRTCLLGSLWRLGNGELRLLALPLGLALGYALMTRVLPQLLPARQPNVFATPDWRAAAVILPSLLLLVVAAASLWRRAAKDRSGHPLLQPMLMLGIAGAILYLLQPGWSYADAVRREVAPLMVMMIATPAGLMAVAATLAGAGFSAWRAGTVRIERPTLIEVARTLAGGVCMAAGASLIPGGNDSLLLATIPAGNASGLVGFGVMTVTVFVLLRRSGDAIRS